MPPTLLIILYCMMIVAASLLGGLLPTLVRLTHLRMQITMSLVSGLMLGVAIIHMLPHAAIHAVASANDPSEIAGALRWVGFSVLAGVVVMFFLLRVFHVHHHVDPDHSRCDHDHDDESGHDHDHEAAHSHGHDHDHDDEAGHDHDTPKMPGRFTWQGLFIGLAIHTLIDGVALAASVMSESRNPSVFLGEFLGLATFLAVLLHKPLDAMSITALMKTRGSSRENQMLANCGFSLACPIGAFLAWSSIADPMANNFLVACTLGFSAGFFLCIALGDLLPEVQFHSHDRGKLTIALLLGVGIAVAVEMMHGH